MMGAFRPFAGLAVASVCWFASVVGPATVARGSEPNAAAAELESRVSAIVDAPEFKRSQWGLLVVDLDSGDVIYERNADKLFAPASTTKLFSCAAAAVALGFDHRFKTPVYATGKPAPDGELLGDLILVARGDLTLGGRAERDGAIAYTNNDHTYSGFLGRTVLTQPDPLAGLKELAKQTARSGVKRVRGEIVVDDRLFDHASSTGTGPEKVTPIVVNDNMVDFAVTPTEPGSPALVEWRPKSAAMLVDASVVTVPADRPQFVKIAKEGPRRFSVRGQINAGGPRQVQSLENGDPAGFARMYFIEALREAGVQTDASLLTDNPHARLPSPETYRTYEKTAELESAPLSENLKLILKVSHNLHASTLPLLLAVRDGERTLAAGMRREAAVLADLGVDVSSISFGGGAGGSRSDFVTPRATVQLLRAMAARKDFVKYQDALPILGVDGTLAEAVDADSPARGRVQAKTGTLLMENGLTGGFVCTSKALAGYLTDSQGRKRAFAFFVNNVPLAASSETKRLGRLLGRLCEEFHRHGG